MTELNIEFIDTENKYQSQILVNGKNHCDKSFCFTEDWLHIKDKKLLNVLNEYQLKDIFNFFDLVSIQIEMFNNILLDINIEPKSHHHKIEYRSSAVLKYDIEDWDKPWSIKQYFYSLLERVNLIPDLEVSCDIVEVAKKTGKPSYDLYDGIGVALTISDPSVSLQSIYNQIKDLCLSTHEEVESELLSSINQHKVERSIYFTPEYHQAGLGILNFFGAYLTEQYPEKNASVKIEQHGLKVKMVIETVDGQTEIIEKALHEYELIIKGEESPAKFSNNDEFVFELKNELRIAQFRLESQRDLIGMQNGRIDKLLNIVGDGLSQKHQVMIDFKPNINLSNTITINQDIAAAISNVNELIKEIPNSSEASLPLNQLENALAEIESNNDPESVRRSPAMSKFKRLIDKVSDSGSDLNVAINKVESGWEIFSELAGKYNKLAEWCCLPTVPSALIK